MAVNDGGVFFVGERDDHLSWRFAKFLAPVCMPWPTPRSPAAVANARISSACT
jgi:hypothetical protein